MTALSIALRIPKGIPEGIALRRASSRFAPRRGHRAAHPEGDPVGGIPQGIALRIPEGIALKARGHAAPVLLGVLVVTIGAGFLAGCSSVASSEVNADASVVDMIRDAPPTVREAYAFAASHPEVLQGIPCYCGCGSIGHTSNYACYIADSDADGGATYDSHALGCSICVDITQDAIRLLDEGQGVAEIRAYIDRTYSAYGPSNMP